MLLGDQGWEAEGSIGPVDGPAPLIATRDSFRPNPPPVVSPGQHLCGVGVVVVQVGDQAEQLGGVPPAGLANVILVARTVSVTPPRDKVARSAAGREIAGDTFFFFFLSSTWFSSVLLHHARPGQQRAWG